MNVLDQVPPKSARQLRREYRSNEIQTLKHFEILRLEGYGGFDPSSGVRELAS